MYRHWFRLMLLRLIWIFITLASIHSSPFRWGSCFFFYISFWLLKKMRSDVDLLTFYYSCVLFCLGFVSNFPSIDSDFHSLSLIISCSVFGWRSIIILVPMILLLLFFCSRFENICYLGQFGLFIFYLSSFLPSPLSFSLLRSVGRWGFKTV